MAVIGYAPGAFDLFHIGHLNILRMAKSECDVLVAGVVSDEMFERVRGVPPFVAAAERLEIVRHIDFVDEVHLETVPSKLEAWRDIGFHRIFKGDDWQGTPRGDRLEADFAAVGVEVRYFTYTVHTTSTKLRAALSAVGDRY